MSRLLFGMARAGSLPKRPFAHLDTAPARPSYNIVLVGVLAGAGALVLNYERSAELINFGAFLAFMGVNAAVIRHSMRGGFREPGHRVFSGLILPACGFLFCLSIWLNLSVAAKITGDHLVCGRVRLRPRAEPTRRLGRHPLRSHEANFACRPVRLSALRRRSPLRHRGAADALAEEDRSPRARRSASTATSASNFRPRRLPRLERAARRFLAQLATETGIPITSSRTTPPRHRCCARPDGPDRLGDDESYTLDVSATQARLKSATVTGAMRGLQTLLQLARPDAQGFAIAGVHIEDSPALPLARPAHRRDQPLHAGRGHQAQSRRDGGREAQRLPLAPHRRPGLPRREQGLPEAPPARLGRAATTRGRRFATSSSTPATAASA